MKDLFDENKSSYLWNNDDYNPRSIRPPPYSQHIQKLRESQIKSKLSQRRSARIPVRTTKAEQLKLSRQQSATKTNSNLPIIRSHTTTSTHRLISNSPIRNLEKTSLVPFRTSSVNSFRQSESARSCKEALDINKPLLLSAMLIKQMRQDIKSNRGKYSQDFCFLEKV